MSASAAATNEYLWYSPTGSVGNHWSTNTSLCCEAFGSDTVGANWLGTANGPSSHMIGGPCTSGSPCGGINADLATTVAGDYCNNYRLPVFGTSTNWGFGQYSGFYPPGSPASNYQQTDGYSQQASTCQAENDANPWGWGQWIQPADNGTNCGNCGPGGVSVGCGDCGIEHYVSLAGTSDYPWSPTFGDGELTVQNKVHIGLYHDHWASGHGQYLAWHYLCPILATDYNGGTSYIEMCANEWVAPHSVSSGQAQMQPNANTAGCATGRIVEAIGWLNPSNPANFYWTAITGSGQSGTISSGASGNYWWEGTMTTQNLSNVIRSIPSVCVANYSPDPQSYRLVGLEEGIESGSTTNTFYLDYFGNSESLLQAWTAY